MQPQWQDEELKHWMASIHSPTLLYVAVGFTSRVLILFLFSELSSTLTSAFAVFSLFLMFEHFLFTQCTSSAWKTAGAYVFVETLQTYLCLLAAYGDPGQSICYAISGTIIFLKYQINLVSTKPLLIFLVCKHYASWSFATTNQIYNSSAVSSYIPLAVMVFLTLTAFNSRQEIATERYEKNKSLMQQEEQLRSTFEAIPDGVLIFTEAFSLHFWNQELISLLNVSNSEASLKDAIRSLPYEPEMKRYQSSATMLFIDILRFIQSTDQAQTFGTTKVDKKYMEWKGTRCTWNQEKACILLVRDNTEWVDQQEKLKLESTHKTTLIRSVSHELRTPANAIINLVREVSEEGQLTDRCAEDLELMRVCSNFLLSMINDLLDFSRVLAGQFALVKTDFNLSKVISQAVHLFEPQCRAKEIDLQLNIDPLLPDIIYSDPNRITQVLLNLLSNAVK